MYGIYPKWLEEENSSQGLYPSWLGWLYESVITVIRREVFRTTTKISKSIRLRSKI